MKDNDFLPAVKKTEKRPDRNNEGEKKEAPSGNLLSTLITPEAAARVQKAIEEHRENMERREKELQKKIKAALGKYEKQDYSSLFEKKPEEMAQTLKEKDFFEQSVIFRKAFEEKRISFDDFFSLYDISDDNRVKILALKYFPEDENMTDGQRGQVLTELKKIATYDFDFSRNEQVYRGSPEEMEYGYQMFGGSYGDQDSAFTMAAIEKIASLPEGEAALVEVLKKNWGKSLEGMHHEEKEKVNGESKNTENEDPETADDSYDDQEYFEDERGGMTDHETREGWDVCFLENRYALDLLSKKGGHLAVDLVLGLIKESWEFHTLYHKEINKVLTKVDKEYALKQIEQIFLEEDLDDKSITRLVWAATDMDGAEHLRKKINELAEQKEFGENTPEAERIRKVRSFFTPNHTKIAIKNLKKFYQENIKFEEYKVNEKMNEREISLLQALIGKEEKVLEMGCGVGRLIKELVKDGHDVSGYDFTTRHVKITKEAIEKSGNIAKVFQGDWHSNAITYESLDTVYSLGRNILHDYSIADQAQLFREANRVLKKGGRFIFDIPNREKGGYEKMVREYVAEMQKGGIRNFRYGTIYDSPDGNNFATRYAYSHEDVEGLARLTGFKIVKVEKRELETGQGDENLYYVLEKI